MAKTNPALMLRVKRLTGQISEEDYRVAKTKAALELERKLERSAGFTPAPPDQRVVKQEREAWADIRREIGIVKILAVMSLLLTIIYSLRVFGVFS
ncbi:hypothetical protein ACIQWS_01235 [Phyllobacterium sp. NPDC097923]|uniref:hypothetical protein n=1 Tax=Phyllobacterium sp. NPDC097923 TaxID=3364404 RepID=UPI00383A6EE1